MCTAVANLGGRLRKSPVNVGEEVKNVAVSIAGFFRLSSVIILFHFYIYLQYNIYTYSII